MLFVHDHLGYPNGAIHGVTTYFLSVLPAFEGSQVQGVLCINHNRHPGAEILEAAGIRPIFLGHSKWDPRVLWDLVGLIREQRIDLLHLAGMKGMLLGRIASRLTGRPAIVHFHDGLPPWPRFLQRRLAPGTQWALAVCEPVRQVAIRDYALPPDLVEVLHNGIAIEKFARIDENHRSRVRSELRFAESALVIGMFGRLSWEKGQDVLLRAMPKIVGRCQEAKLLVVGDGPTRSQCERLCSSLNLRVAVHFTGHRKDVAALLSAVDVVAVPSVWEEPLPYVAVEALCAGRPVVAFGVGGIPEIVIDGETGFLVPKGDVDALADALVRLLEDPALRKRLAEGGRQHAQNFTVNHHVQRLTQIYRMLTRGERPSEAKG